MLDDEPLKPDDIGAEIERVRAESERVKDRWRRSVHRLNDLNSRLAEREGRSRGDYG